MGSDCVPAFQNLSIWIPWAPIGFHTESWPKEYITRLYRYPQRLLKKFGPGVWVPRMTPWPVQSTVSLPLPVPFTGGSIMPAPNQLGCPLHTSPVQMAGDFSCVNGVTRLLHCWRPTGREVSSLLRISSVESEVTLYLHFFRTSAQLGVACQSTYPWWAPALPKR